MIKISGILNKAMMVFLLGGALLGSKSATALDVKISNADNSCPNGYQLMTVREANNNKNQVCSMLGQWYITRLAGGGSMDGPGYKCGIRSHDNRGLGNSLCVRKKASHYYRLTTQFRGNGMCLDVFNGGPKNNMVHLTQCADFSGQYWHLKGPDANGWQRLTTMFRGEEMCLDIFNGGKYNNQPHLTKCANFSGQYWKLKKLGSGGKYRLTTQFRGDDMCLDIFNGGAQNNQPHLTKCANFTGQFWKLTKTNKATR